MAAPRVVIVHRTTELDEMIARHGTRGQAEFFLRTRGQSIDPLAARDAQTRGAIREVSAAIELDWRRASVERSELARFAFGPEDVVVVVGQDGLVANVAKYLHGQPVVGINPAPDDNPGVLVPHGAQAASDLLHDTIAGRAGLMNRTMVQASMDDGQRLLALNEIYIGQPSHQSARYTVQVDGRSERQVSSGLIVGTGTGSTGWLASLGRQATLVQLPRPEDPALAWFVREAWPSPATGVSLTAGVLQESPLSLRVESESLVSFGDGIEDDRLWVGYGQQVVIGQAQQTLRTVR